MKKIYILFAMACLGYLTASAQLSLVKNEKSKGSLSKIKSSTVARYSNPGNSINPNAIVLWSDDFGIPANWVFSNPPNTSSDDWVIGTNPPSGAFLIDTINSTTQANGFALYDSDLMCSGDQIGNLTNTNPIDLTGNLNVRLNFEQYYRKFHDSTYVYVSNNGSTWTKFIVNGNLSDNSYSGGNVNVNPNVVALDISAVAGNQDSVYVRFQYYSPDTNLTSVDPAAGCGYSWMIDDVSITKIEQVDGKLMQAYAGEYTVLPILQAEAFTLQGRFINNGVDPISGAQIYFTVLDPIGNFYYDTSNVSGTVNPGDTSSYLISSGSYLPAGFGEYLIDQTLVVANDSDNTNDLSTGRVLVDDSIYARDFTVFENDDFRGSIGLQGQTVSFAEKFHIYQLSQFTSVSVYLDNPTLGDTVNLSVHNSLAGMPTASIGVTANYTITANDTIGVFLTLPFPAPVTVNPGDYFVAINQLDTNFLTLGLSENIYTPNANFFNISGGGWFPLENANLKRALLLRVNNPEGTLNSVKENKNKSTFNLYPNPTNGVIYITGNGIQEKEVTVRIVNGLGQVVKFATYDSFIFSRIDLSEFSAGIYTVNVSTASGEESKNIILQ